MTTTEQKIHAAKNMARAFAFIRHETARANYNLQRIHCLADIGLYAWHILTGGKIDFEAAELMEEIDAADMGEIFEQYFSDMMTGAANGK